MSCLNEKNGFAEVFKNLAGNRSGNGPSNYNWFGETLLAQFSAKNLYYTLRAL